MRTLFKLLPLTLLAMSAFAPAQNNPPAVPAPAAAEASPWSDFNRQAFGQLSAWVRKSAEKMPEESYGFKPTESVRSFGQIVGHVADSQYLFCSAVLGVTNPAPKIEASKTTKRELVPALQSAFAYCDAAYASMTDLAGAQNVKFIWGDMPKITLLNANAVHLAEHYGNIVTYLRIRGIVPPSSEPGALPPRKDQ